MKAVRFVFWGTAALVLGVGAAFSYLAAQLEDAPGLVIVGTTAALVAAVTVFGIGEVIILLKKNDESLSDIRKKLGKK